MKSTFSHFMLESERLIQMKEEYEKLLDNADFYSHDNDQANGVIIPGRESLVRTAKKLRDEAPWSLFKYDERLQINNKIATMAALDSNALMFSERAFAEILQSRVVAFEAAARGFIQYFNQLLILYNLSLNVTAEKPEIDRMYDVAGLDSRRFRNTFGIWISPQMEAWCRELYIAQLLELDNIVPVEGIPGFGKSTFITAAMTTVTAMNNLPFSYWDNYFFKESREFVAKSIREAKPRTSFALDEAGNQLNSKSWWVEDQMDLVTDIHLGRKQGYNLFAAWKDVEGLDKGIRNKRATWVVTIKERGEAIVRTFNKNPYVKDTTPTRTKYKDTVMATNQQASEVLKTDPLTVMVIPFYAIPDKLPNDIDWIHYNERKEASRRIGSRLTSRGKRADDHYLGFLLTVDPTTPQITSDMVNAYAEKIAYSVSCKSLVYRINKAIGIPPKRLWHSTAQPSEDPFNAGYIENGKVLSSWIRKLQAEKQGSDETKKEEAMR